MNQNAKFPLAKVYQPGKKIPQDIFHFYYVSARKAGRGKPV